FRLGQHRCPGSAWRKSGGHRTNRDARPRGPKETFAVLMGFTVTLGVGSVSVFARTIEPRVGTWKLNVAKSQFSPGPPPQSNGGRRQGRKNDDRGSRCTGTPHGDPLHGEFRWQGLSAHGSQIADTGSLRRINARITVRTDKKDGKVIQTLRRIVSEDGKTMIVRADGMNAQGQPVESVAVWKKR